MEHPISVLKYSGSLEALAKDVGEMRYDSVAEFITSLADEVVRQAEADRAGERVQLASKLEETARKLYEARDEMQKVWRICKPYMK